MVRMTAQLNARAADRVIREVRRSLNQVSTAERAARTRAAVTATRVTRASFQYKRPGHSVPPRFGRQGSQGRFTEFLEWRPVANQALVAFDIAEANARVPYWIIQELGTGESATLKHAERGNPRGRPTTGANYVVSIPNQSGRLISSALGWASGPGGTLTAPGAATGQQLYLISQLAGPRGGRVRRDRRRRLRISREIEGQHFVRTGSITGFREYADQVFAVARRAFTRRGA